MSLPIRIVAAVAVATLVTLVIAWISPASPARAWTLALAALGTLAAGIVVMIGSPSATYPLRASTALLCFAVPVSALSATAGDLAYVVRAFTDESLREGVTALPTTDAAGDIVIEGRGDATLDLTLPSTAGLPSLAVFELTDPIGVERSQPSWSGRSNRFSVGELDERGEVGSEHEYATWPTYLEQTALVSFADPGTVHGLRITAEGGWRLTIPQVDALPPRSGAIRGSGLTILRYTGPGLQIGVNVLEGSCTAWNVGNQDRGTYCPDAVIGPEGLIIAIQGDAWSIEPTGNGG